MYVEVNVLRGSRSIEMKLSEGSRGNEECESMRREGKLKGGEVGEVIGNSVRG